MRRTYATMIYTLPRDDIPLLSQWIKNLVPKNEIFWLPLLDAHSVCYAAVQSFAVQNVYQRHCVLQFVRIGNYVRSNNCDIMYITKVSRGET